MTRTTINCNMSITGPLWVLKPSTIELLSIELNSNKELLSEEGHLRDWRGLAELSGLTNLIIQKIQHSSDPTKELLTQWKKTTNVNIEIFFQYLETIDRFDVIDDNKKNIKEDIAFANKIAKEKGLALEYLDTKTNLSDNGKEALTFDDLIRLKEGLDLMQYDAFILYGDDDKEFTEHLVKRLENQGLKVCIKDRDLLGGAFEHEAVMNLIAQRCRKLVPIFSPSFFTSENNKFLTCFGQHIGIEKCTRTLIPVLYKSCDIPPNLAMYHKLVYKPNNTLVNFWQKLTDSIKPGSYKLSDEKAAIQANMSTQGSPEKKKQPGSKHNKQHNDFIKSTKNDFKVKVTESSSRKKRSNINKQEFSNVVYSSSSEQNQDSSEPASLEIETQESRELLLPDVPKENIMRKIKKTFTNKKSKNKYSKDASLC